MSRFIFTVFVLLATSVAVAGDSWPQFRGPTGDGLSDAVGLPLKWSETENVVWKTPIHGRAWSSPVVLDNQIWFTTAPEDGSENSVL
ncbi:MAG TPA: PQQ-binding-like beta-propeller repeat protein, partial [Thermoguttaceae bacterium]|nr:PQQ-binding-like beta-propeller repeat protein [Thermoguttaceae bacterium]